MKVSVILCTYNRSKSLVKALDSIARLVMPESVVWEVLIIDNNSKDETRTVAQDFSGRFPGRFRYIFESKQGKSNALNTALREADGDLFAFVDDDVEVDQNWLRNLTAPFENGSWSGAGGRILPESGFVPPHWLDVNARDAFAPLAIFDQGEQAGELHDTPYGTNMAFRKEMFARYGNFRTDLGPQPGNEVRNEDTEFGSRLLEAGERFWYEPSAVVFHSIPAHRVQKKYFLRWWFDKARADIRQHGVPRDTRWYLAGIPLYMFRRLAVWTVRWICTPGSSRRFLARTNALKAAGTIYECYQLAQVSNHAGENASIVSEPRS